MRSVLLSLLCLGIVVVSSPCALSDEVDAVAAEKALRRAVAFMRSEVSTKGGYLWRYSEDLSEREGEGKATTDTVWIQPPGTPSIGESFLLAFYATKDDYYLQSAVEVAHCLVEGQLESGGWDYRIEFGDNRDRYAYRTNSETRSKPRNVTTLDDNTTQAALQFLMRVDEATQFQDQRIQGAVKYALEKLLAAQYPVGGWPQRFSESPDAQDFPILRASYPSSWSRTHPDVDYRSYYTFNDGTLADMIATMFEAHRIYGEARYRAAAEKAGGFVIAAQMPEPQPVWAQQYNAKMQPAWARRFEPASVTGGESQGVIKILLMLYRETRKSKYLEPIPRALDYLKASELDDGRLARFYELKTNRPLYFTKDYQLTYSDADMPTHYAFKVASQVDRLRRDYDKLKSASKDELQRLATRPPHARLESVRLSSSVEKHAAQAMDALDSRGAWVTSGTLKTAEVSSGRIIDCRVFIDNARALSEFLAASRR